jgi:serine/threonine-protein kinase
VAAVISLAAAVSWLALIALEKNGHDTAGTSARFDLPVPDLDWSADETGVALSPAGDVLAYSTRHEGVWLRRLDEVEARRLPGTEEAVNLFWSPDGGHLGYVQDDMIQVVDLTGGPARTVARGATFGSPTWGASDIVYAHGATDGTSVLFRVAVRGGQPEQMTHVDPDADLLGHAFPTFLPDGLRFLYLQLPRIAERPPELFLGSLDGGEARRIDGVHSRAEVASGFLFYSEKGVLLARPFDVESIAFRGEERIVAPLPNGNVARTGQAMFSVASSGVLAYATSDWSVKPMWFDREGRQLGSLVEPGPYSNLRISPTGDRVAARRWDPATGGGDLWIVDVARSVQNRVPTGWSSGSTPVWSPDGRRLAYSSSAAGAPRVFLRDADGRGEPVPVGPANGRPSYPSDWSPDGTQIAVWVWEGDADTRLISLGDMETSQPYLTGPGDQIQARFSPDGRWVAFASSELGSMEVFIAPADDGDVRYRVSASGGTNPTWSPDGRGVFFTKGGAVHAASFAPETATIGIARELFSLESNLEIRGLDLARDGRFLVSIFDPEQGSFRITVELGWRDLMER